MKSAGSGHPRDPGDTDDALAVHTAAPVSTALVSQASSL